MGPLAAAALAILISSIAIVQSLDPPPADMVMELPFTPSAVVRFRIPPEMPPKAASASFHEHPEPAVSVVTPSWSPNIAQNQELVCVAFADVVFDCAMLWAPVNDDSAPVNTATFKPFAVNEPVLVLLTVMLPGAVVVKATHVESEHRPATLTLSIFVQVRLPPATENVLDSSAIVKAARRLLAGGEKLAVVAGFDVPFTKVGVEPSRASTTPTPC
jgi:hypothetical protein